MQSSCFYPTSSKYLALKANEKTHIVLRRLLQDTMSETANPAAPRRSGQRFDSAENFAQAFFQFRWLQKQPIRVDVSLDRPLRAPILQHSDYVVVPIHALAGDRQATERLPV